MSGGEILVRAGLAGLGVFVGLNAISDIAEADRKETLERALEANGRAIEELSEKAKRFEGLSEETKQLRLELERMRRECRK